MKRRNVQMAFVGEGQTAADRSPENIVQGDEAVDIDVRGGKLMVTVTAGTPDEELFTSPNVLGGELILENGIRFSFEIQDGAVGAHFTVSLESQRADTHEGLSALPDIPGGA